MTVATSRPASRRGGPLPARLRAMRRRLWAAQPRRIRAGHGVVLLAGTLSGVGVVLAAATYEGVDYFSAAALINALLLDQTLRGGLVAASPPEAPYRDEVAAQVARARRVLDIAAATSWIVLVAAGLALAFNLAEKSGAADLGVAVASGLSFVLMIPAFLIARCQQVTLRRVEIAQGLRPGPLKSRRRPRRPDLPRARRALLPLVRQDWPWSEWRAPSPGWDGARECWIAYARLHQLAACFLLGALLHSASALWAVGPGGLYVTLPVLVFCAIAITIALLLARALSAAVAAAPPAPSAWWASRERALALARIYADARNFLLIYLVALIGGFIYLAVSDFVAAGSLISRDQIARALGPAAAPYAAGVLSLLTLGALAWVNSVYKELAVLRAEVAHRARHPHEDEH